MMKIIKISEKTILENALLVKQGEIIVFPTDTVYGLGCDPFIEKAVQKIYEAKKRDKKHLPILVSNIKRLTEICKVTPYVKKLAETFWPGQLTMILPSKVKLPKFFDSKSIAVRIPKNIDTVNLIEKCGGYLVGTSANISGLKPPRTVFDAYKQLRNLPIVYLDGGITDGIPSTIIMIKNKKIKILREGAISSKELFDVLGETQ